MTGGAALLEAGLVILAEWRCSSDQGQTEREQRRRQASDFELAFVDHARFQVTDFQADSAPETRQTVQAFKVHRQRQLIRLHCFYLWINVVS